MESECNRNGIEMGFPMESKWILNFFSYRYTFDSQRISHGFRMGPQWILNFSRIDILWIPHGFPMGSQWTPNRFPTYVCSIANEFPMGSNRPPWMIKLFSYRSPMDPQWPTLWIINLFSYRFLMDSQWIPSGF